MRPATGAGTFPEGIPGTVSDLTETTTGSPANAEADVISAIDALERDGIDELVDWQMSDSPAANTDGAAQQCPTWPYCWYAVSVPTRAEAEALMAEHLASDSRHANGRPTPDDMAQSVLEVMRRALGLPDSSLGPPSGPVDDSSSGENVT